MKKALLCALLSAVMIYAAEVAGKWEGRIVVDGADNDMDVVLSLKGDAGKLAGTIAAGQQGNPIELQAVKLDGDKLTFDVPYRGQTFKFDLTAGATQIQGTLKGAAEDGTPVSGKITLKKAQ